MTKEEYIEKYKLAYDGRFKRCTFCEMHKKELIFLLNKVLICYSCLMGW